MGRLWASVPLEQGSVSLPHIAPFMSESERAVLIPLPPPLPQAGKRLEVSEMGRWWASIPPLARLSASFPQPPSPSTRLDAPAMLTPLTHSPTCRLASG
jgi:hypothetical protein